MIRSRAVFLLILAVSASAVCRAEPIAAEPAAAAAYAGLAKDELADVLERWDMPVNRFQSMSPEEKEETFGKVMVLESALRLQVLKLKRLAGEQWKRYVYFNGRITEEGKALLSRSLPDQQGLVSLEQSLGASGGIGSIARRSPAVFDGSGSGAEAIGELAAVGTGAAGVASLASAAHQSHVASVAWANASAQRSLASSLAAQARAANAAHKTAIACSLCAQSQQAAARAKGYDAQAAHASGKASHAASIARILTAIGGGIAVADGLWDLYKGFTGFWAARKELSADENELARRRLDEGTERMGIGAFKTLGGTLMLVGGLVLTGPAAPVVVGVGVGIYFLSVLYGWLKNPIKRLLLHSGWRGA